MFESVSEPSASAPRPFVTAVAVAAGLLVAATIALWAFYGSAVFYEIIVAGLNACF